MAHVEGTFGAMLQGVSQQPDRLRTEGQVTVQDNFDSDVAEGLSSRPGSLELGEMVGSTAAMNFTELSFANRTYIAGFTPGILDLWEVTSTGIEPLAVSNSNLPYVGEDMVFAADPANGRILCLNRDFITAFSTTVGDRVFHAGVVSVLGGVFSRTYRITVSVGSDSLSVTYTTPDGTDSAHAAQTSADFIAGQLRAAWEAASNKPAALNNISTIVSNSEILFRNANDAALTITTEDGEQGTALRAITDIAQDVEDLPRTALHDHIVLIRGGRSEDDDFYLRWDSDATNTPGAGFGSPGVWRETARPDIANGFVLASMPHTLTINPSARTAALNPSNWLPRRVGDANTNPTPDFIGTAIRDMLISEERLVFVANGGLFASRSGSPLDLWNVSATTESPEDPIAIRSNSTSNSTLDWIVPFDRDLLLVADRGKAQFVVTGGLAPRTSSMVLTTEYDVDSGARPVSTGRTIVMPYRVGDFVGINEFVTNGVVSTNSADPITAVQDEYISGRVRALRSAENFNRFGITATGDSRSLWTYRYLWRGTDRLQAAWHRYQFLDPIRFFFFDSTYLYVIVLPEGAVTTRLLRLNLNRPDDDVGFHITLDRRQDMTVGANNQITVPYNNAAVVQRAGCSAPGLLAISTSVDNGNGTFTLTLQNDQCPVGATVTTGQRIPRRLEPTQAFARDRRNNVMSNVKLHIKYYLVHLSESGSTQGEVRSPYRPTYTVGDARFPLDDEQLDPNRTGVLESYVLRVPVRELTTRHDFAVISTDIRPTTILEVEWEGDLRNARRRV